MKNIIIVLFFLCLSQATYSQEVRVVNLDDFFNRIAACDLGIGSVAIYQKENPVYIRTFGDTDGNVVNSNHSSLTYQIGSITKMLTAIMTFQLAEASQLSLDETIDTYFPAIVNGNRITISHLLSHSSSLGDYVTKSDSLSLWLQEPASQEEIYHEIIRQGSLFAPGDSTRYSNSGYYLLARILEKKCNKPYSDILFEKIIQPLGLTNTKSNVRNENDAVQSYHLNADGKWIVVKDFYFPNVIGVGDITSTTHDLNKIIQALFSYQLINQKSLEQMKPIVDASVGKGIMKYRFHDKAIYGHRGETYGTQSMLLYNEDDGMSIAMNINGIVVPMNAILLHTMNLIYGYEHEFPYFKTSDQ